MGRAVQDGDAFRKSLPHAHCLPEPQDHLRPWPGASCFEGGFRWWGPALRKGKRWGPEGGCFPEGGKGGFPKVEKPGGSQHKGILQAQGRKRGPEVKCETEIRDVLGSWRERAADGSRCFSVPLNLIQGKIVQKGRVCGRGY